MTFLTELNRLKEAATKGPWTAVRLPNDNRDDQYYVDDEYEAEKAE